MALVVSAAQAVPRRDLNPAGGGVLAPSEPGTTPGPAPICPDCSATLELVNGDVGGFKATLTGAGGLPTVATAFKSVLISAEFYDRVGHVAARRVWDVTAVAKAGLAARKAFTLARLSVTSGDVSAKRLGTLPGATTLWKATSAPSVQISIAVSWTESTVTRTGWDDLPVR